MNHMNKHRGSNFDDYLKEKGISEEVSKLARERWETLQTEASLETENAAQVPNDSPGRVNRLLHRLRYHINHLLSQLRSASK